MIKGRVLINCFEPANIVVRVGHDVHVDRRESRQREQQRSEGGAAKSDHHSVSPCMVLARWDTS